MNQNTKNTRHTRANGTYSEAKEINHVLDEEYNSNSNNNDSTLDTELEASTSILVGQKKCVYILVNLLDEMNIFTFIFLFYEGRFIDYDDGKSG